MNKNLFSGALFGLIVSGMYFFTNINFALATLAYLFLILGLFHRKNRQKHIPLMCCGIFLDLALVLFLQFTRSAIQTAMGGEENMLQMIHIGFSTLAVVFYIPVLITGFKTKKNLIHKKLHLRLGVIAFTFRTVGFIFMFSQLNKK